MEPIKEIELDLGQRGRLEEAFLDAFNEDGLSHMLRIGMGIELADTVDIKKRLPLIVSDLIVEIGRSGHLGKLLLAARAYNPGNGKLNVILDELNISRPEPINKNQPDSGGMLPRNEVIAPQQSYQTPVSDKVESVSNALEALAEMMRDPKIRQAAISFQSDFDAASSQIELLAAYKKLHDLLHTLQLQCYNQILAETAHFPGDQETRDRLYDHSLTLQLLAGQIEDIVASKGKILQVNTDLLLNYLTVSRQDLSAALDTCDQSLLKKAAAGIRRVQELYLTRLNIRLNEAAKNLRLSSLLNAMATVSETLAERRANAQKTAQFAQAVKDLSRLNNDLTGLLREHDIWQSVDDEMGIVHLTSDSFADDLKMQWPNIRLLLIPLCAGNNEKWAADIRNYDETLQLALQEKNELRVKDKFRSFRRSAGQRFYDVDFNLNTLCSDLRKVGEPLIAVLKMMA